MSNSEKLKTEGDDAPPYDSKKLDTKPKDPSPLKKFPLLPKPVLAPSGGVGSASSEAIASGSDGGSITSIDERFGKLVYQNAPGSLAFPFVPSGKLWKIEGGGMDSASDEESEGSASGSDEESEGSASGSDEEGEGSASGSDEESEASASGYDEKGEASASDAVEESGESFSHWPDYYRLEPNSGKWETENQDASPYDEPAYKKAPGTLKPALAPSGGVGSASGEASEVSASGLGGESNLSVTTETRFTYELERYNVNALLLLNISPEKSSKSHGIRFVQESRDVSLIEQAFRKFGFEIETENCSLNSEIDRACTNFFQRDFTDCGVVVVVVIAKCMVLELPEGRPIDIHFNESNVLRHFGLEQTPTLSSKPKLLFTEACGQTGHMTEPLPTSYQTEYPDVLRVHMPKVKNWFGTNRFLSPMVSLCVDIARKAERYDILTIVNDKVATIDDPHYADNVINTLQSEVYLSTTRH